MKVLKDTLPEIGTVGEMCQEALRLIGEDPNREGLLKTPFRYEKALKELTSGYNQDLDSIVYGALFEESYSEMVLVRDIEFFSLCEHHLLPFFGKASVAYIPNGKIIGLSKIPRIVHMYARRLQVQERLTEQVTTALTDLLKPHGVACMIEASHLCMMMRGIQTQSGFLTTTSMKGAFLNRQATREEFLKLVTSGKS